MTEKLFRFYTCSYFNHNNIIVYYYNTDSARYVSIGHRTRLSVVISYELTNRHNIYRYDTHKTLCLKPNKGNYIPVRIIYIYTRI